MKKYFFLLVLISNSLLWSSCGWMAADKKNAAQAFTVFIPTGASLEQLMDSLQNKVVDIESLQTTIHRQKFKKIYPGRYTIPKDATNAQIVKKLQMGQQDEIEIMIGNYVSIFELAQKLDPFFEIDSSKIIEAIALRQEVQGIDTLQWIYFLAPNTYKFHWNNTGKEIIEKIAQPYQKYWTAEKKALLDKSGLTEMQVVALASLVQLESYKVDEQPKVAGLYLNRLKINMKLDADPSIIFAKKINVGWDQKINRVYYKDLNIESPYNTYRNRGIPPGPICMPNPSAIDAVLNPAQHDYIYFVADPAKPGYHIFAKTLAEQEKNAKQYRDWADKNQVK